MVYWRRALWFLALAALFFRGKIVYVSFYTVLLVFLLSRWLVRRAFARLQVDRSLASDRLFVGEEVEVTLTLRNPTWIPLVWVMASEELPPTLVPTRERRAVVSLGPRGRATWTYRVTGRRRGVHTVGPITLEAGDPFGLEQLWGRSELFHPLLVYPKIRPLSHLGLPSRLPFGEVRAASKFLEDPARLLGVREYAPGDTFNRIHWKVTARAGRLMVKEYQPTIALETMIYLNLHQDDYELHTLDFTSELAIEVAASIAYYLHGQRQPVGLVTNGTDPLAPGSGPVVVPVRKGAGQLATVLELLAKIAVTRGDSFERLLAETARNLPLGTTLILVTPTDSPALVDVVLRLYRHGYHMVVICVEKVQHSQFMHHPPGPGLIFHQVRTERELDALGLRASVGSVTR